MACVPEPTLNHGTRARRSTVAYAVHTRMYPTLRAYARAALRNMSACPRWMSRGGFTTTPIDLWFSATDDIHHYAPGIAVQGGWKKPWHQQTMRTFAERCVV